MFECLGVWVAARTKINSAHKHQQRAQKLTARTNITAKNVISAHLLPCPYFGIPALLQAQQQIALQYLRPYK
jgi:hypothetical protein